MEFDVFFSICQTEVNGYMPDERTMFANFFEQVELADRLGFGTAWVAESHLSSEVQKRNREPVVPHWQGEVGLNCDILQTAHAVFRRTRRIERRGRWCEEGERLPERDHAMAGLPQGSGQHGTDAPRTDDADAVTVFHPFFQHARDALPEGLDSIVTEKGRSLVPCGSAVCCESKEFSPTPGAVFVILLKAAAAYSFTELSFAWMLF